MINDDANEMNTTYKVKACHLDSGSQFSVRCKCNVLDHRSSLLIELSSVENGASIKHRNEQHSEQQLLQQQIKKTNNIVNTSQ
jgi:hypothetical protein